MAYRLKNSCAKRKTRVLSWHRKPRDDFKAPMELAGFKTTHPHNKVIYHGIRLLTDNELDKVN